MGNEERKEADNFLSWGSDRRLGHSSSTKSSQMVIGKGICVIFPFDQKKKWNLCDGGFISQSTIHNENQGVKKPMLYREKNLKKNCAFIGLGFGRVIWFL